MPHRFSGAEEIFDQYRAGQRGLVGGREGDLFRALGAIAFAGRLRYRSAVGENERELELWAVRQQRLHVVTHAVARRLARLRHDVRQIHHQSLRTGDRLGNARDQEVGN